MIQPTHRFLVTVAGLLMVFMVSDYRMVGATAKVDNSIYAELLQRYVIDGKVNYKGFKSDEQRLDTYLEQLAVINPAQLDRMERFSFFINAYNAWTIKLILTHYPGITSIKDAGTLFSSPWKKKIAHINGHLVTLDHIEHDILRPEFKDPRVHFAINCAAKSCPPLAGFPMERDTLDRQLDALTRHFINDPKSNYLAGNDLWVSRIFKWFGKDFNNDIVGFFLNYANGELKNKLKAARDRITVKYVDYDWSLNGE